MLRTLTVLAVAVCAAAPALAGPQPAANQNSRVLLVGDNRDRATRADHGDRMMGQPVGPYGAMELPLPTSFYKELYRLTPREYRRLRAEGFRPEEVYMIANASIITGLDPIYFENAIYQGDYSRQIAYRFALTPGEITRVRPEWRTPEWGAAIGEKPYSGDKLNVWW